MSEEFLYPEFETKWSNSEIIDMLFDWAKFCMKNKTGDLSNDTAEYFSDKLKAKIAVCSPNTPPTIEEAELWKKVIDLMQSAMKKGLSPEEYISLMQGLGFVLSRRSKQNSEAIEFAGWANENFGYYGKDKWAGFEDTKTYTTPELFQEFQLFKKKQSEPEPATPGQWYARLEGCKTTEDVEELEKKHADVINANPDLRRLLVIYKMRLKKNLS